VFVFPSALSSLASDSLLTALQYGGGSGLTGKARNLLKQAVGALLNASRGAPINYYLNVAQVIQKVDAALASQNQTTINNLQSEFDSHTSPCPL
jgi:hypothetical protein